MKTSNISAIVFIILFVNFSCSPAASASERHQGFLECLVQKFDNFTLISDIVYTSRNPSFASVLQSSVKNLRLEPKPDEDPQVIVTPKHESHIPPVVHCSRESGLQIRTRSGGHDYEGLSYLARVPFVLIDLINLSQVTIDVEKKTAWVESGATLGILYYRIAEKSQTLGFPAGVNPSVGVGGHFSGGGYGILTRKYGVAADNVIDARIIDVNGRILDRRSMGEDLFWAIRGGGGASFGVILSWKVQLVDVPERVTAFIISRTLEQNVTQIIHRWQHIAPKIDQDLFLSAFIGRVNSSSVQDGRNMTISASFLSVFLGRTDRLIKLMQQRFPELGLVQEDCMEMSWVQSILYMNFLPINSPEALLNRVESNMRYNKAKSDYVQKPIPMHGFEGIWKLFFATQGEPMIVLLPYGGRMDEISESTIPFSHRSGNLYSMQHLVYWGEENAQHADSYISWIRRLYRYVTPFVSNSPRLAYVNYRDLDIGKNNIEGKTSYAQASIWGYKYFENNFKRLVKVKTRSDPENFFRNEQSIPSL